MQQWQQLYTNSANPSNAFINPHWCILWCILWWTSIQRTFVFLLGITLCWLWSNQPLLAATTPGAEPTRPLFPTGEWQTLAEGASHWYAFRDEGDGAPIVVRLTVVPEGHAAFAVITPAAMQQWRRGEPLVAVGEGSPLAISPGDLYWTGSFVQSGTYYVRVQSRREGVSDYRLTINGRDVSFPLLSFAQSTGAVLTPTNRYPLGSTLPPPVAAATVTATVAAPALSSAEQPLPPIGKPMTITVGKIHWYAFRDEGDAAPIQVSADATPDQCLAFEVWTPEQFARWQQGEAFMPVGQGTANATLNIDRFWSGSFVKSGIYYVVVKQNPAVAGPCTYKLLVLGDDVSLIAPATP